MPFSLRPSSLPASPASLFVPAPARAPAGDRQRRHSDAPWRLPPVLCGMLLLIQGPAHAFEPAVCAEASALVLTEPGETRWRGSVIMGGVAHPFTLTLDRPTRSGTPVRFSNEHRTMDLPAPVATSSGTIVPVDPAVGERFEGRLGADSFTGLYYAPPAPCEAPTPYPFHLRRIVDDHEVAPDRHELSGEWRVTLRRPGQRERELTALVGHGRTQLHAIWREPNGSRRFLSGLARGTRFAVDDGAGGAVSLVGRYDPLTKQLSGTFTEPAGTVSFVAVRHSGRRLINLASVR